MKFEEQVDYTCANSGCSKKTLHRSGYCAPCRTKDCAKCKKQTVFYDLKNTQCSDCSYPEKKAKARRRRMSCAIYDAV
jgi:hypothetical protein